MESLKVGQLRLLCKQRGLPVEGKKEELISRLLETEPQINDMQLQAWESQFAFDSHAAPANWQLPSLADPSHLPLPPVDLSQEDLKEIATITDEIRHIRRQWTRFFAST